MNPSVAGSGAPSPSSVGVIRCPTCGRSWLVVGLKAGDPHICKTCGCQFAITRSLLANAASASAPPAREPEDPESDAVEPTTRS